MYVKRVIGKPGDCIEIKDGYVYRNHKKIKEPYIKEPMNP
ncbi:S26 family signal peptidase, partial [Bacillus cereus]